ncbi:MAG: CoA ester lyase [Burkholderiales bacterium]|nr:CoA ester lyase [Burkholderiales bacterium]
MNAPSIRSEAALLFVPANRPERFAKALASGAGALILDLEDSVPPAAKDEARAGVAALLAARDAATAAPPVWVRVNPAASGLLLRDLAAVVPARPFGVVLPKCCGRASLETLCHQLDALEVAFGVPPGATRVLAIATETGASMFRLGELAGVSERLWGITWGGEDLAAEIGALANREGGRFTEPYRLARSLCLYAAAAAGVRAVDTVSVAIDDDAALRAECEEALRDGFVAKMAIHPRQLPVIAEAFRYTDEQRRWAERVLAAFAEQPQAGALQLDGRMIDRPHLRLAQRMLGR